MGKERSDGEILPPAEKLRTGIAQMTEKREGGLSGGWSIGKRVGLLVAFAMVGIIVLALTVIVGEIRINAADAESHARVRDGVKAVFLLVILTTLTVNLIFGYALWRSVTRPLKSMTEAMALLAAGDAAVQVPATARRDEIGDMARALVVFRESIAHVEELSTDQENEREAREQRAAAVETLAGVFDRAMAESLESVTGTANELRRTAEFMSSTAEQTNQHAAAVNEISEEFTTNARSVAATSEQLSASIAEISEQVMHSATIAAGAVQKVHETNTVMKTLAEAAAEISGVVELINQIAGQTNLLALNATIEAARAGEAGKGFAVVANEVKNLASQTAKATEGITTQIDAIQSNTEQAVKSIDTISGIIGELFDSSTNIAGAVDEQSDSTQEIANNVKEVAEGANKVSGSMSDVSADAHKTDEASRDVVSAAQFLTEHADKLQAEVKKFLKGVRAA